MAEGAEIEDQVDFDDENNYIEEEMDDEDVDVEEVEEEEGGDDENSEEREMDDLRRGDNDVRKEQLDEEEEDENDDEEEQDNGENTNYSMATEDKEKGCSSSPFDEEEREKRTKLLSLPPHSSEVFIGALPRDISEEDLLDLCEPLGEILEVRLMKNRDTGETKGFAFVAFGTKDVARNAIEELHNKEFKGRTLRCSLSETKYRLFIGNVPKDWTYDDFRKVIEETGPGAETIELIKDPQNPCRNRGFAFVEYYNNACADYSRQKMTNADFKLEGNTPTVTWADPKITASDHSSASAQVKALYVKNIPENTSTEQLKELFQQRHGEVTKVVMPPGKISGKRDFGFVHFAERSSALKATKDTNKYEINGQVLEVVLARPQSEKKGDGKMNPHNSSMPPQQQPNYIPHPAGAAGFGVGFPYGTVGAGVYGVAPTGYQQQQQQQQPMIFGRESMTSGMQMVPMVLPDGRIGYVLQQPGVQMRPNRRNGSGGGPQGRGRGTKGSSSTDDANNHGRRYRPY